MLYQLNLIMIQAIKVRIYPNRSQAEFLTAQFGAVRFVYNKGLHLIRYYYHRKGISLNAKRDIKKLLPIAKKSRCYAWLKGYDSISLQQSCINLSRAYDRFFDPKQRARYPRFKSRHGKQSSYHCMGISVGADWIKVPKLTQIKAKIHRFCTGALKRITVSRTATGKYFASLLFETGEHTPKRLSVIESDKVLGIDMGLTDACITSQGEKIVNPRFLMRASANLRRKQKLLSRKEKGSASRARARKQVARCHEKVVQARGDFQHKVSRRLIDESQAIIVETLKVKNMLRNRRLSKHIADISWHSLIGKLSYKAAQVGKHCVKIDPWFASTKRCHCCLKQVEALPLSVRTWECPHCAVLHDRDINAALNIKHEGIMMLKTDGTAVSASGGLRKTGILPAVA